MPGGPGLRCDALDPVAVHVFTTREWALGAADGDRAAAWATVASAAGVDRSHLARAHQVHGASHVAIDARAGVAPVPLPEADILVTANRSCAVAIQTADCVPLLIADRRTGAVAAAHAGWRGLAQRVPHAAVAALADELGTRPPDLIVAIGPAICGRRYEVGADVWQRFADARFSAAERDRWFSPGARAAHWWFDGPMAARDQLIAAGVNADAIHIAALCTADHPELLCSYRRDGKAAGRMAAVIRPR